MVIYIVEIYHEMSGSVSLAVNSARAPQRVMNQTASVAVPDTPSRVSLGVGKS